MAGDIFWTLGFPDRTAELARIAGYLHDIGNLVSRVEHSQSGAVMAFRLLDRLGMEPAEIKDYCIRQLPQFWGSCFFAVIFSKAAGIG